MGFLLVLCPIWALRGIRLFDRDGSLGDGLVIATLFAAEFALLFGSLLGDVMALGAAVLWGATTLVIKAHPQAGWLLLAEPVTPALAVSILLVAAGIWTVNQTEGRP